MATRALIGYLDTEGVTRLTTTYNHYDGYPSNLGKALKNFFDSDSLARDIAEYGYISYIDPSNGDIEANNRQAPGHVTLPDNFEDAMDEIAAEIDAHGADYGYIWDNSKGEWITIENDGIGEMSQELEMELQKGCGKKPKLKKNIALYNQCREKLTAKLRTQGMVSFEGTYSYEDVVGDNFYSSFNSNFDLNL
jgi:hypothetical protein